MKKFLILLIVIFLTGGAGARAQKIDNDVFVEIIIAEGIPLEMTWERNQKSGSSQITINTKIASQHKLGMIVISLNKENQIITIEKNPEFRQKGDPITYDANDPKIIRVIGVILSLETNEGVWRVQEPVDPAKIVQIGKDALPPAKKIK
jgi:hypothetical protein